MSDLEDYYKLKMETVKAGADIDGSSIEQGFLDDAVDMLSDAGLFDDAMLTTDCRDAAGRWMSNGYAFDENSGQLTLFTSLIVNDDEPQTILKKDIDPPIKKLKAFVEMALWEDRLESKIEPTFACYEVARFIRDRWNDISRLRFLIISNLPASERMQEIKSDDINGKGVTLALWDLTRIYLLESSGNEREDMVIDLSSTPISCLVADDSGEDEKSILCVMPGQVLYDLYDQWGARLLEQNVRSFLQARGKVNKGIRHTILEDSKRFFAYNNGLTTTAEGVKIESTSTGPVITELKNLQIVNGGQTTASLFSAGKKDKADLSNISVQMKLTVASSNEAKKVIPNIARYANSQNKVSEADLFSNHPYHIRIEEFSRRVMVPAKADQASSTHWFYERARGQFLNEQAYKTPGEKTKFLKLNPNAQKLTKTDLAKVLMTWDVHPRFVSMGAQKNFSYFAEMVSKEWESNEGGFNELYFKNIVWKAWVFRAFEKSVLKAPWYAQYRANVVTYSIGRLAHEVNGSGLTWDSDALWRATVPPQEIMDELMRIGEQVSEKLLDGGAKFANPSEYAKKTAFWDVVEKLPCDVESIRKWLISTKKAKEQEKDAQETQKIDDGIGAQEKVINTKPDVWEKIERWLMEEDSLTGSLAGIIKSAKSFHQTFKLPSEKQCKVLVKLLEQYSDRL